MLAHASALTSCNATAQPGAAFSACYNKAFISASLAAVSATNYTVRVRYTSGKAVPTNYISLQGLVNNSFPSQAVPLTTDASVTSFTMTAATTIFFGPVGNTTASIQFSNMLDSSRGGGTNFGTNKYFIWELSALLCAGKQYGTDRCTGSPVSTGNVFFLNIYEMQAFDSYTIVVSSDSRHLNTVPTPIIPVPIQVHLETPLPVAPAIMIPGALITLETLIHFPTSGPFVRTAYSLELKYDVSKSSPWIWHLGYTTMSGPGSAH